MADLAAFDSTAMLTKQESPERVESLLIVQWNQKKGGGGALNCTLHYQVKKSRNKTAPVDGCSLKPAPFYCKNIKSISIVEVISVITIPNH